jgi:hypothetical protein
VRCFTARRQGKELPAKQREVDLVDCEHRNGDGRQIKPRLNALEQFRAAKDDEPLRCLIEQFQRLKVACLVNEGKDCRLGIAGLFEGAAYGIVRDDEVGAGVKAP